MAGKVVSGQTGKCPCRQESVRAGGIACHKAGERAYKQENERPGRVVNWQTGKCKCRQGCVRTGSRVRGQARQYAGKQESVRACRQESKCIGKQM
jgi:hypothetical protein